MKHGRSRFLTTLAQFHSNRSRLIHGVQFNPFSRLDRRQGRPMEKHRSYRGPLGLPSVRDPPQSWDTGGFHTSIHYTYFKLSISPRRLPFGLAARIRRKGSGWIAIGTTMRPYKRRGILGSKTIDRLPFRSATSPSPLLLQLRFPFLRPVFLSPRLVINAYQIARSESLMMRDMRRPERERDFF